MTIGLDAQNRYFEGVIDEVRIYRRALSDAEVAALAAATNQSAAAWYRRYYGDTPVNWTGDSDGDGFSQMVKYALGGNPRLPDTPLRVQARIVGDRLQVIYPRLVQGTTELTYEVDGSTDLRSWTPLAGAQVGVTPVSDLPGYEWATFEPAAPISANAAQFIRIRSAFP